MSDGAPVRLVLDTSAVLAFAAGSIQVGEPLTEVVDEGARFGVPVLCLVEAARLVDAPNAALLSVLARHTGCVVLPMLAEQWEAIATATVELGRPDLAVSLIEALRHSGYVLTGEPARYDPDGKGEAPVIGI